MFDIKTRASDFVNVLWLSIAAEAFIRWAENTNFIAALSKPFDEFPKGDNQGFRMAKASIVTGSILLLMFFIDFFMRVFGKKSEEYMFSGQNGNLTSDGVHEMLRIWGDIITEDFVVIPLALAIIFRAIIYKRPHTREAALGGWDDNA